MEKRELARHHLDVRRHVRSTWRRPATPTLRPTRTAIKEQKKASPFRDAGYVGLRRSRTRASTRTSKANRITAVQHFAKHLADFKVGLRKERRAPHDIPRRPRESASRDREHPDVHDLRRSRLHGRLEPQPDVVRPRLHHRSLGVTTARNALASYTVFQDWGNDPDQVREARRLQEAAREDHAAVSDRAEGPGPAPANDLDRCSASKSRSYHGSGDGPRSRRAIRSSSGTSPCRGRSTSPSRSTIARAAASCRASVRRATSRAVSIRTRVTAQTEQIPAGPFTDGKEVLLVIAPLQVIGPPLLDELVAPAASRSSTRFITPKKLDPKLQVRLARHERHGSGRHRGVGIRSVHARSIAAIA